MGIVAFQWGQNKLTLLQNRENGDTWPIEPAVWDKDGKILRGLPEENLGTWFGMSAKGRVAFIVDHLIHRRPYLWMNPVYFLRGEMSPRDYAEEMSSDEESNRGLIYEIIVADINSNSMVHISKKKTEDPIVVIKEVGFRVHTLSSIYGLDHDFPMALSMKNLFNEIIDDCKKEPVPTPKEMAKRFIYDSAKADQTSEGEKEIFKTMSTTALVVKPTKVVMFYERYLVNGDWKDHGLSFKME